MTRYKHYEDAHSKGRGRKGMQKTTPRLRWEGEKRGRVRKRKRGTFTCLTVCYFCMLVNISIKIEGRGEW